MKFAVALLLILITSSAASESLFKWRGPLLTGSVSRPECEEALTLAQTAFASDSPRLYAPLILSAKPKSAFVLGALELDISGGDALQTDGSTFEKFLTPQSSKVKTVYWQTHGEQGRRLVVQEIPHGWRGETYSAFITADGQTINDFVTRVEQREQLTSTEKIVSESWRPPLVFQRGVSGPIWLIDVGQPFIFLGAWSVYALELGSKLSCSIDFRPRAVKDSIALLPAPTANLFRLLDKAIGSGEGEGTQQSTTWIRVNVQHTLANTALRPWALQSPHNSRAEVDFGLDRWAHESKYNRRLFQALRVKYPKAERALAAHYHQHFDLGQIKSKQMAAYALDIAYRSHFVFSKENADAIDRQPKSSHR
jgi:hypothetical protein